VKGAEIVFDIVREGSAMMGNGGKFLISKNIESAGSASLLVGSQVKRHKGMCKKVAILMNHRRAGSAMLDQITDCPGKFPICFWTQRRKKDSAHNGSNDAKLLMPASIF